MARASTDFLRREIARSLRERPFAIELWDGSHIAPTVSGRPPTLFFRSPAAISQLLRSPGELGLGRAYVLGDIETDDLGAVAALIGRWKPPRPGPTRTLRILLAAALASGFRLPPSPPAAELRTASRIDTSQRGAEAVRHHYDVSNEFYALFLDQTMTYSCAYFGDGAATLEEAQRAKLELVCAKLGIGPGSRMLDVGCGWGSLAIHAAQEHGASVLGITLSRPQASLAAERALLAGVSDRVEIRVLDYRELGDERFDAIASIGMVEHVGERQLDGYARRLVGLLNAEGRILNQGITRVAPVPRGSYSGGRFFQRYVFPGAELLNLSRVVTAFERAGLEAVHIESLRRDYAETLRHWAERLEQRLPEAESLIGAERVRVWRLYLVAARDSFESGQNAVSQILCASPSSNQEKEAGWSSSSLRSNGART